MIEVRPGGHRRIDRVLSGDYVRGLAALTLAELRQRRDDAAQEETDLSYLRRLLHVRIDLTRAEQRRRRSGGDTGGSVLDSLPAILADNALGPAPRSGRYQQLEPSLAGEHRAEAEALVGDAALSDVAGLSEQRLAEAVAAYGEQERTVSARRREVQGVVDALNGEIATRYAKGTASVDELINRERAG